MVGKGSQTHGWLVSHVLDIKGLIKFFFCFFKQCLPLRKTLLGVFYCPPSNYSSLTGSIDINIIMNVIVA